MIAKQKRAVAILLAALFVAGYACSKSGGAASPSLVSIAVSPSAPGITLGNQEQFSAQGTYSDR